MEAERELAKFLDKHLYTKDIFTRANRTDNASTQIDGSDIILSIPSLGIDFESEGYNKEKLLQIAQEMRVSHQTMIAPLGKPYRFYYTQKLAEQPVNILLNKEEYIRLGEFHFFVKP